MTDENGNNVKRILNLGVEKKRKGDYSGAEEEYLKALQINKNDIMVYYSLAKLYYITKKRDLSIKNYLIAMHLYIEQMHTKNDNYGTINRAIKSLPDDLLFKLPNPYAVMIFKDPSTPRHIAHSITDLDDSRTFSAEMKKVINVYQSMLSGKNVFDNQLLKLLDEYDKNSYIPHGQEYLLNSIKWSQLNIIHPSKLYG